jgi:dTDP-4-dehydrorhamnose 3,5-epimerase
MKLNVRALALAEIKLISTSRFSDRRGDFAETYVRNDFAAAGIPQEFVQDNLSRSHASGTVRGLHFQIPPLAQAKLVRVLRGRIFDVCVDLRRSSPRYGRHVAVELAADAGDQLFVPAGFAHGFCTLEPETEVFYKVDAVYSAEHERGLGWSDPVLAIPWPVAKGKVILSDRDSAQPWLQDLPIYFE